MKIAEIAFKVKPGSQMYKNFFIQEEEETKFLALAFRFIDKYFGKECDHSFKIAPQLSYQCRPRNTKSSNRSF